MAPFMERHPELSFRELAAADVPRAAELEAAGYPEDEAATPEKLEYRQRVAPELFYGVYEGPTLVAFVVSTAARGAELEEESMSAHEPGGDSVCVHSVCVAESHRRRGIARAMVKAYVEAVKADRTRCAGVRRMLLLSHAPLLGLYGQCGFALLGPSKVAHGADLWYDMRLDLAARRQVPVQAARRPGGGLYRDVVFGGRAVGPAEYRKVMFGARADPVYRPTPVYGVAPEVFARIAAGGSMTQEEISALLGGAAAGAAPASERADRAMKVSKKKKKGCCW